MTNLDIANYFFCSVDKLILDIGIGFMRIILRLLEAMCYYGFRNRQAELDFLTSVSPSMNLYIYK